MEVTGDDNSNKQACFGRETKFFQVRNEEILSRIGSLRNLLENVTWHWDIVAKKSNIEQNFCFDRLKTSGGSSKFQGGLQVSHSAAQTRFARVVTPRKLVNDRWRKLFFLLVSSKV